MATTVVLDTNVVFSDFFFRGAPMRLLRALADENQVKVVIPAPVVEELVAVRARDVQKYMKDARRLAMSLQHLGVEAKFQCVDEIDYRADLVQLLDETLGFTVAAWPDVSHESLTFRAVNRRPPFDTNGGGYRDSLIWATVMELAAVGGQIVLASKDNAFSDDDQNLHQMLEEEIAGSPGSVSLVRDLGKWLKSQIAWASGDIETAIQSSQDNLFHRYLIESDALDEFVPHAQDLDLPLGTFAAHVHGVEWDGTLRREGHGVGPGSMTLVDYGMGLTVEIEAQMSSDAARTLDWGSVFDAGFGVSRVTGEIALRLQLSVLFDRYDMFAGVESINFVGDETPAPPSITPIPGQMALPGCG